MLKVGESLVTRTPSTGATRTGRAARPVEELQEGRSAARRTKTVAPAPRLVFFTDPEGMLQ
jgi:hypothetical protein